MRDVTDYEIASVSTSHALNLNYYQPRTKLTGDESRPATTVFPVLPVAPITPTESGVAIMWVRQGDGKNVAEREHSKLERWHA